MARLPCLSDLGLSRQLIFFPSNNERNVLSFQTNRRRATIKVAAIVFLFLRKLVTFFVDVWQLRFWGHSSRYIQASGVRKKPHLLRCLLKNRTTLRFFSETAKMLVCPFLEKLTFNNSYISILSFFNSIFIKKNIRRAQGYDPTNFSFLKDDGLLMRF